jgi:CubicO group peptidase (beta-lactamase class C family)
MIKFIMKIFNICILTALISFAFSTATFSDHLKGKSKKEIDKYLEIRTVSLPAKFDKIKIKSANKIKNLNIKLIENKNIKNIDKNIKNKSLLSVLYFDGKDIVINKKSEKIKNDTKLYSFSISKSFVSYILGEAICNGHIKSLEDKISIYVPETKGTVYENSTFKELINMSAGDTKFSSRKPGSANLPYASKVGTKKTTVKDYLILSTGVKLSKKKFNYNNLLTDLVARAIDTSVPGGLKSSYESLANKSGTASEMYFLTDDNGWPLLHAWFYATREDFLRLAIQVSQDWNSKSCVGNYLNKIENMKINTRQDKSDYSGYFWYDQKNKSRHVQMRGHGGQRIHIDLEEGSILIYHSITKDYDNKSIWNLIKN